MNNTASYSGCSCGALRIPCRGCGRFYNPTATAINTSHSQCSRGATCCLPPVCRAWSHHAFGAPCFVCVVTPFRGAGGMAARAFVGGFLLSSCPSPFSVDLYIVYYLSIHLPTYLSIISVYLSACPSIYLIHLPVCLSLYCLSIYIHIYLSLQGSLSPRLALSLSLYIYLPLSLSLSVSLSHSVSFRLSLSLSLSLLLSVSLSLPPSAFLPPSLTPSLALSLSLPLARSLFSCQGLLSQAGTFVL